ncbi:MAG: hypothetical protein HY763_07220 [Planctomycetes bacterium]|nr:hypothetical protein [Planctomycetota bacterium]
MMQPSWQVETPRGVCAATGRRLEEGEEFFTVLFEDGESFRRADYAVDAWQGPPPGTYCHFKSRVPVKVKRKQLLVDDDMLAQFFLRLAPETEPVRVQFRFVLALILMRKRKLRYDGSRVSDGVEVWQMTLLRDQSTHRVVNPRLTDDQIAGVSAQLTAILHGDMGQWATEVMEPTDGPAEDRVPDAPS